jgi:hypothetical protein
LRDDAAAKASLRSDVKALRKGQGRAIILPRARVETKKSALLLSAAERIVFLAFLMEEHRQIVYETLSEEGILETHQGSELAREILTGLPEAPKGSPREWLHQIEPASAQILIDLDLETRSQPISKTLILETIEKLRERKEEREIRQLRSQSMDVPDNRKEHLDRLRKQHERAKS